MKLGMVEGSLTNRRIGFQKPRLMAEGHVSPKPHRSQIAQREVRVCEKWRFTVASESLKVPSKIAQGLIENLVGLTLNYLINLHSSCFSAYHVLMQRQPA